MDKFRKYNISFSGLKTGKHEFVFEADEKFFDLFETEREFTKANIKAEVLLEKHSTFLDIQLKSHGTVNLICDISTEEYKQEISNEMKILVKFGETYDDSNEEIITIPFGDSEFNIAQLLYESVMLAIPMKKISPEVKNHPEYAELLEKFSPKYEEDTPEAEEEKEVDPRWAALKKLNNNNSDN